MSSISTPLDTITFLASSPNEVTPQTQVIGTPGINQYWYWILAYYPIGTTITSIPAFVGNAPNVLDNDNYVLVFWDNIPGVNFYQVIRTSTPTFPTVAGNWIVSGVGSSPVQDNTNPPPQYFDPNSFQGLPWGSPVTRQIILNNRDFNKPTLILPDQTSVSTLIFPDNSTLSSAAGVSGPGGNVNQVQVNGGGGSFRGVNVYVGPGPAGDLVGINDPANFNTAGLSINAGINPALQIRGAYFADNHTDLFFAGYLAGGMLWTFTTDYFGNGGQDLNLARGGISSPDITWQHTTGFMGLNTTNPQARLDINGDEIVRGNVRFTGLPTSSTGLVAGDLWNNGGVINIV